MERRMKKLTKASRGHFGLQAQTAFQPRLAFILTLVGECIMGLTQKELDDVAFVAKLDEETVAANFVALIAFNQSMACALGKASRGSKYEDGYFVEKLEKTADRLGYNLVKKP